MSSEEERARVKRELAMASAAALEQEERRKSEADHSKTCVFTALTNQTPVTSKGTSDSGSGDPTASSIGAGDSYVIRKKHRGSSSLSEPASRSTYIAIQKGQDIPLSGLQRSAPQGRQSKGKTTFLYLLLLLLLLLL